MAADIFSKFKKDMEVKFAQEFGSNKQTGGDITGKTEKFLRLGPEQDPRKVEMIKAGKEIAEKRGIAFYNPMMHSGAPLGQRAITPYTISGTDIVAEPDDLHYVNNAAMQQMWDDIRRTCVVGLDMFGIYNPASPFSNCSQDSNSRDKVRGCSGIKSCSF